MKNVLLILSLFFLVFSCNKTEPLPPNTYEIYVSAKGVYNGLRAHLKIAVDSKNEKVIDTAIIMNEVFSFKGKVNNASIYMISINGVNGNVPFVLEPGIINIEVYKDSIYFSKVDGTINNEVYNTFKSEHRKRLDALKEVRQEINDARNSGNNNLYAELVTKYSEINKELEFFSHEFITAHPNSDFSLILLEKLINGTTHDLEKFTTSFNTLTKVIIDE